VRSLIVGSDVRLELDDAADAPTRGIVADEPRSDQFPGGGCGRARQERPLDDAQPPIG
jgi:hypothetical protein